MIYQALANAFLIIGCAALVYYAVMIIGALIPNRRRGR